MHSRAPALYRRVTMDRFRLSEISPPLSAAFPLKSRQQGRDQMRKLIRADANVGRCIVLHVTQPGEPSTS